MKQRASVSGLGAALKAAYLAGESPAPGTKGDGSIYPPTQKTTGSARG